jgi:hypothetical protein
MGGNGDEMNHTTLDTHTRPRASYFLPLYPAL